MPMTLAQRSRHAPAILAYIRDRFRPSQVDSAIYINCPITNRYSYDIYPEGGLQPAGYYIAINGEVDERDVWDTDSPLYLETTSDLEEREIYPTARVGLTLKRMYEFPEMPAYLMRPLRFLTDPTISKGKLYTVASLIEKGLDDDAIRDITGTTRASITRARTAIDDGKTQESFKPWKGKKLKTADLHTLYGVYLNVYGEE